MVLGVEMEMEGDKASASMTSCRFGRERSETTESMREIGRQATTWFRNILSQNGSPTSTLHRNSTK